MSMTAYSSYTIVDLVDGIVWKGELSAAPENPQMSWAYHNTVDRKSYIYTGNEWVVFVRDGENGDYVKYLYQRTNTEEPPAYPGDDPSLWLDEAQGVTAELQYEYVVTITTRSGVTTTSTPRLWAKYGRTIVSITEQYAIKTNKADTPTDSDWRAICPDWSEGQFLWTRTKILYSDDSVAYTDPVCTTLWEAAVNSITSIAQIQQGADANGGYIQAIVRDMITYNVGEVSPSYGMSYDDAMIAVPLGTVYVPTVAHSENLIPDTRVSLKDIGEEIFSAGTLEERESKNDIVVLDTPPVSALETTEMQTYDFEVYDDYTYRYEWTKNGWIKGVKVSRSTVYYEYDGTAIMPYLWYCPQDVINESSTNEYGDYKAGTLYAWKDKHWIAISTTTDSLLAQSISLVRQTANSYTVELRDLQGNYSEYKQTVDKIGLLVAGSDGDVGSLEVTEDGIYGTVKANSASIGLVVENNAVKGSVIIKAINDESQAIISADKVNLNGYVTVTSLSDNSTTTINGAEICSGVIKSNNYTAGTSPYSGAGTYINLSNGAIASKNFAIDSSGNLHLKGDISATNARLKGGLQVGSTDGNTYNFVVEPDGDVTIKGILNATDLQINGTSILDGNKISSNYLDLGNIQLDGNTGDITLAGNINISGNIQWGSSNSPISVLYARTSLSAPTYSYSSYPNNSSTGWHRTYYSGYDLYASYTYDGGNTWTTAIKIVGEDGTDGDDGDDASVTRNNIVMALTSYMTKDGIYSYYDNDTGQYYLGVDATYIKTGVLNAAMISLDGTDSYNYSYGLKPTEGDNGKETTYGYKLYSARHGVSSGELFVSNSGVKMLVSDFDGKQEFYVTKDVVYTSGTIQQASDARVKNGINYDMSKYDDFFMSLKPVSYQMSSEVSQHTHIGYVAQDVKDALLNNRLSTKDFDGLYQQHLQEPNKHGLTDMYTLGYTEFIALNTHMIQKLYKRIEELETKLNNISEEKE